MPVSGQSGWWAADHPLELDGAGADQRRWRQGGLAGRPVGEAVGQLDRPAVDQDQAAGGLGMADGQLQDHVGPPALAGHPGAPVVPPAEIGEHGEQVVGQGGEVVAVVGLVRPAVAALVDGGHRVAGARPAGRPPRPTGGRWRPDRAPAAPGSPGPSRPRVTTLRAATSGGDRALADDAGRAARSGHPARSGPADVGVMATISRCSRTMAAR